MAEDHCHTEAVATIVMAAGRGSRMRGFSGNKTLLPLAPNGSPFEGRHPILLHLLASLPAGPKALVVHHGKEAVIAATRHLPLTYCEQPRLNGTGGAILAARGFIEALPCERVIITMGDVPFVRRETYAALVSRLAAHDLVVLGFEPADRKRYGVLEIEDGRVRRITEWKYWKDYAPARQAALTVCNSGIYAITRQALRHYLPILHSRPQIVHKEVDGRMTAIEEFFITDLVEYMVDDGRAVGFLVAPGESETMGIDDGQALERAQEIFRRLDAPPPG
jgi:bifunctional UDP-N-acetylglucosamine pyrophosphorylase/glucosamine-1-phosphate N-acetyltransferase